MTLPPIVGVHFGLRGVLAESGGIERELEARGWYRSGDAWCLYGIRRDLTGAVVHEATLDVRRWLYRVGWKYLPDGSSIAHPRREGLVEAARVEHDLRERGTAVSA